MASVSGRLWPGQGVDRRDPHGHLVHSPYDDSGIAGAGHCAFCDGACGGYPDTDMAETAGE